MLLRFVRRDRDAGAGGCDKMTAFEEFERLLKKERRTASTIDAHLDVVRRFATFQETRGKPADIDQASPGDIAAFVEELSAQGESAKALLWSLHNYYRFSKNRPLHDHALGLRRQAMEPEKRRRPAPKLSLLAGASQAALGALRERGIETTAQLLKHAASAGEREQLARDCGVPQTEIDELAFFADLSRITDIKGKRGRFLLDAGIRTVDELRAWGPEELRSHLAAAAVDSGRRAPTDAETKYWVRQAKQLPDVLTSD
jgi:predicted flap endonuclease-1-like 5' DNA nuclease